MLICGENIGLRGGLYSFKCHEALVGSIYLIHNGADWSRGRNKRGLAAAMDC
jgi:hypothetical protein